MSSLLRTEFYYFTDVSIKANPEWKDTGDVHSYLKYSDVKVNVNHAFEEENALVMSVSVSNIDDESEHQYPYYFNVDVLGRFISEITDDKAIAINKVEVLEGVAALLFSAVSDKVNALTAQMPFGSLFMPLLDIGFREVKTES